MIEGKRRRGRGELIENLEEVTHVYQLLLGQIGLKNARRLLGFDDELKVTLAGRGMIRIELD